METSIFRCPQCTGNRLRASHAEVACEDCARTYPIKDGVPAFLPDASKGDAFKQSMQTFWGGGWSKRDRDDTHTGTRDRFLMDVSAMRLLADIYEGNQMREMADLSLEGKHVLEIGCGAAHSSMMFALEGARVVASDLTASAAAMARQKFNLLGVDGMAVQADAEHLPFADETFDVIFSSGVLHHTPNIEQAVAHIERVLKPGGHAVVMLYAQRSCYYLVSLLLIQGFLLGGIARHGRDWLGHLTERGWLTGSGGLNPLTRVYSRRAMRRIFRKFDILGFRQYGFNWADLLPGMYRIIPRRTFGVGDVRAHVPSAIERAIGRMAGFSLTIHVQKPSRR